MAHTVDTFLNPPDCHLHQYSQVLKSVSLSTGHTESQRPILIARVYSTSISKPRWSYGSAWSLLSQILSYHRWCLSSTYARAATGVTFLKPWMYATAHNAVRTPSSSSYLLTKDCSLFVVNKDRFLFSDSDRFVWFTSSDDDESKALLATE